MESLTDPTVLIAGATGNIGFAAATALAKRGARVVLLGRRDEKLRAKAKRLGEALAETGVGARDEVIGTLVIDFADLDAVRQPATETLGRFPTIDGLVLSVGAFLQNGPTVLPNGHEAMFATNVVGPFLFTELLLERLEQSDGLVVHVIAPFHKELDWNDLESIETHKSMAAFNRTKTCNRMLAGEMARRYAGRVSSVAFDPTYVIDRSDPELEGRWPTGMTGLLWRVLTLLFAQSPSVAGEPIARLMLEHPNRRALNGALYRLDKRVVKPDEAMHDPAQGKRLWDRLSAMIRQDPGVSPRSRP